MRPFAHWRKPQLGDVGTDPDYRFNRLIPEQFRPQNFVDVWSAGAAVEKG